MDIFRWIKREWDTTQSCKRRDSAPPIITVHNFRSPKSSHDEAYLRALKKFNEWRRKERQASNIGRISRKSSLKSNSRSTLITANAENDTIMLGDATTRQQQNNNNNNDDAHLYEELLTPQKSKQLLDKTKKFLQKSHSLPATTNNNNNTINLQKTFDVFKSSEKCPVIDETAEIEEFENDHCKMIGTMFDGSFRQSSPPKRFFKDNSNPFKGVRSPPVRKNQYGKLMSSSSGTPRCLFGQVQQGKSSSSLSKDKDRVSLDSQNKKYDFNPSAIYENQPPQVPAAGATYQSIVNRHGDVVDYAVPFNDRNEEIFSETKTDDYAKNNSKVTSPKLRSSTVPCITADNERNRPRVSMSLCDLIQYAEIEKDRKSMMVTDLDKSDDASKLRTTSTEDVLEELSTLENWSKRITSHISWNMNKGLQDRNLIVCTADDISQRSTTFRSTMPSPILLSSGNFRRTSVSLRRIEKRFRIQSEQGLTRDLSILNKIKHPNVALLMAVCLDVNDKILSIVMEPFVTNINCLIYDSDYKIPLEDCIEYALQVTKAIIYLHENGLIHSNICSHNILICENKKMAKLSSFELATEIDSLKIQNDIINTFYGSIDSFERATLKPSIGDEGWNSLMSKNQVPTKFLPYLIDYRRLYSEHYYQSPELLSTSKHFVFPTRQSDVYSIALLLWEMLNSCVPFAIFAYDEIENLFQLNESNQLPLFDSDRCEPFKDLLENGLSSLPSRRIENVQSVRFLIDEAKSKLSIRNLSIKPSIKSLRCRNYRHDPNEVSTTNADRNTSQDSILRRVPLTLCENSSLERSVNFVEDEKHESASKVQNVDKKSSPLTPPNRFASRSLDDILQIDSSDDRKKNDYKFRIDAFSLPSTPIARRNKLRRNAWLSNRALYHESSFNETEEDALEHLNNKNDSNETAANKNKLLNVSIKIIQNKIDNDASNMSSANKSQTCDNSSNVSAQIDYWNNITSPSEINLKKQNNTEVSSSNANSLLIQKDQEEPGGPTQQSTPIESESRQRPQIEQLVKDRAKYYPNMPELLSETFLRRSFRADDNNFDRTLWKREKLLCETSSPRLSAHNITAFDDDSRIERPLRTSVKEAVHKFESFSKSDRYRSAQRFPLVRSHSERININTNKDCNKEKIYSKSISDQVRQSSLKADIPTTELAIEGDDDSLLNENNSNSKIDAAALNDTHDNLNSSFASKGDGDQSSTKIKGSYLSIYSLNPRIDNSPRSNCARKTKPTLFSVNIRKLNRRASDVGCVRKVMKRNGGGGAENSLRHSICGSTDIVRTVARMNLKNKLINSNGSLAKSNKSSVGSLTDSDIQYCKLSCWKCGSKIFKMDEMALNERSMRTKRCLRRFANQSMPSEKSAASTSPKLHPGSSAEEIKSTEDLYIDDDFNSGGHGTLGANMRLLSPEQDDDLFDILSIDFLSTEIFESME